MADSLLKEVDDALRADRASALWNTHKKTVIAFAAALVIGTSANSVWQSYQQRKGGETLAALSTSQQLLNGGNAAEAAAGFKKIAGDTRGEVKALALVWQARALLAAKQTPEAIAALKEAVADGHTLWSDIACLRLAGLDAAAAAPCLADSTASPLAATRAEWSAASLWSSGKTAEAIASLDKQIANADTSPEGKARLSQWAAGMKASQPKAAE